MPGIGSTACKAEPGSTHSNNHTLRKWQRCRPSPRRRTRCSCGPGPPRSARQGGQLPDDAGHGLAARRLPLLRAARRGGDHLCTRTRPCPVLGRVVSAARPQALPQAPPRPGPSVPGAAHVCGPLPLPQPSQACLGQQAVVPVDVVGVEAQLALLGVLLDGRGWLILEGGRGGESRGDSREQGAKISKLCWEERGGGVLHSDVLQASWCPA